MAITIKQLIKDLQSYEDQDQPIVYTYYVAADFTDPTTDDNMEPERFKVVADRVQDCDTFWDDVWEGVVEAVTQVDTPEEQWEW